jgi:hypothetical protein
LVADRGAGATLALQAVAHGNAHWLALDHEVKLPATTGGASCGHSPLRAVDWRSVAKRTKLKHLFPHLGRGAPRPF